MPTTPVKGTELSTIDVNMIVLTTEEDSPKSLASTTQTKIEVEPQIETTEAVKNIVKGRLLAQKPEVQTITGNTITLTDNTTILELIEILQGGTITRDEESQEITGYTPPVVGSEYKPVKFTTDVYSAVMDEGGNVLKYEKISYPGCKGAMVGLGGEDNVFRVNTYTINSAPAKGQAPYALSYVDELPQVGAGQLGTLTVTSAAGEQTGATKLTVSPEKEPGNSYKYKTGASVSLPAYDEVCTSGWSDWDGAADVTAATGQKIVVAEVDSANKAKKAGTATVTAKA